MGKLPPRADAYDEATELALPARPRPAKGAASAAEPQAPPQSGPEIQLVARGGAVPLADGVHGAVPKLQRAQEPIDYRSPTAAHRVDDAPPPQRALPVVVPKPVASSTRDPAAAPPEARAEPRTAPLADRAVLERDDARGLGTARIDVRALSTELAEDDSGPGDAPTSSAPRSAGDGASEGASAEDEHAHPPQSESASDERTRKLPPRPQPPSRRLEPTVKRAVELPNDVPLTTPSTGAVHRPLPPRADGSARAATSSETLGDSDALDGRLIVELAVEGTVFINGVSAGRGTRVVLTALDRFARHALRVEAEGCLIWHGTVLLDGREVAKVRPVLKPRD